MVFFTFVDTLEEIAKWLRFPTCYVLNKNIIKFVFAALGEQIKTFMVVKYAL